MSAKTERNLRKANDESDQERRPTKKDQILALFLSGIGDVADIALITRSRPSYVGAVLQDAGLQKAYFDLYTSTSQPMNVYSKFFAGQLTFKNEEAARRSVEVIDRLHRQFELAGDSAGQHHALLMALTMFNRARWTNKKSEAEVFRRWLLDRLEAAAPRTETERLLPAPASAKSTPTSRMQM